MTQPKYSMWGAVQHCEEWLEGVFSVSTAGHGGVLVTPEVAKLLS